MNLQLERLEIRNFKGIRELTVHFSDLTNITGPNESGKTSIVDAFRFLFFGKDSSDRADFNIKNTVNTELNRLDHEVAAFFTVDGQATSAKRIYREKWVKKRGNKNEEYAGNEQLFEWNNVPLNAGEFKAKVSAIMDETIFKLVSDPLYFNSLKWNIRRDFLIKLAGEVSDTDIAGSNQAFQELIAQLKNKSFEEFKKEISSKRKLLKEKLEVIPTQINENLHNMPEEADFSTIETSISQYAQQLEGIDREISDVSESYKQQNSAIQETQRELYNLRSRLTAREFELKNNLQEQKEKYLSVKREIQSEIDGIESDIKSKNLLLLSRKSAKEDIEKRTSSLRELFAATNEKELKFGENQFECPTCKREFEAEDIAAKKSELQKNFNDDKIKALNDINATGSKLVKEAQECDQMISTLEKSISTLTGDLELCQEKLESFEQNVLSAGMPWNNVQAVIDNDQEYLDMKSRIAKMEESTRNAQVQNLDLSDFTTRKQEINAEISKLRAGLSDRDQIQRIKNRNEELSKQQKEYAQQLADVENLEFVMADFQKAKIDTVESRVKHMFQYVSFRMFNTQVNGGVEETCETLYKGVPFPDLNTAGKIWAGIDIINTLCRHYKVNAPIFLDNRESVTDIPYTDSQVINLKVGGSQLTVAN